MCCVCVCVWCVCVCCVCVCCMCVYMYVCGCCLCCRYMYMCMIWCCRYMFYGLLFMPCVKKMALIIQFVHLANTSSICMHVCHVHMMCVWVMCYVFNYIQQSPRCSLTTTLYLSHTLSTCGPSSHLILNTNSSSLSLQWNAPLQPDYVITAYTLPRRVPCLKSQSEMWAPPSTVGACSIVVLLTRPQSSSIPTTPAAFSSTRSTV